jgi:hypothetical protein
VATRVAIELVNYPFLRMENVVLAYFTSIYIFYYLIIIIKCTIILPTSEIHEMIYYKVAFETINCLRPFICIEFRYDMTDNNLQRLRSFVFFLITCIGCSFKFMLKVGVEESIL